MLENLPGLMQNAHPFGLMGMIKKAIGGAVALAITACAANAFAGETDINLPSLDVSYVHGA